MRSTVRIDDNLMEALRTRSEEEGLSITRMLNRLLRSGLAAETAAARRPRFRQATARMGRARVDLDKALSLAAALEDEEIVRKLSVRRRPTTGPRSGVCSTTRERPGT